MSKPSLSVIQGAWQTSSKWLSFPKIVAARSPLNRDEECSFRVARDDALKAAGAWRRQPIFEFWAGIMGCAPPVNNVARANGPTPDSGLSTLAQAHACFMGVRRPCGPDDDGGQQVAYIMKPTSFYEYEPSLVCVAKKSDLPPDVVFVAYARLDEPCTALGHKLKGVITHWHFVLADSADATLPEEYQKRYDTRLW